MIGMDAGSGINSGVADGARTHDHWNHNPRCKPAKTMIYAIYSEDDCPLDRPESLYFR